MTELAVRVDKITESDLRRLSEQEGSEVSELAARLLARAVRAARPRPVYDIEAIQADMDEFGQEDLALAESGLEECAALLAQEDAA